MPKLLQINVSANWGSTGKIAEQINQTAMAKGWKCKIAYSRFANESESELIQIGTKKDVLWAVAETRLLDRAGLSMRRATKDLIRQIQEFQPDVIHLHNIHGYVLNYELLFGYLNKTEIKVVWTFHDFWAITGHCAHFVDVDCMKWKTGCHHCPKHKSYPSSFTDFSARNYALKKHLFTENTNLHIVAVSEWVANYVRESFFKDNDIRVIHNGVDLQVFRPLQVVKDSQKFNILAVSNIWTKSKGIDDILQLREMLPNEFSITIVGLSEKQITKLPFGIKGITRTQNTNELIKLYNHADVLINPTYADSFPTVNLEALACGTPVITYKTGGSPEAVDSITGAVLEQGNVKEMVEMIKKLKAHPLSSEDCRSRAEKIFDKNKCFARYVELYEE
jgi:glycosyltransferase involved in cell wall biosynthesis